MNAASQVDIKIDYMILKLGKSEIPIVFWMQIRYNSSPLLVIEINVRQFYNPDKK